MRHIYPAPTEMDKAVESVQAVKRAYEKYFEDELLAQFASIFKTLQYNELVKSNGQLYKVSYVVATKNGKKKKITVIKIGKIIKKIEDVNGLINDSGTLPITPADIYTGLSEAYNSIARRIIENGEQISGITADYGLFSNSYHIRLKLR